MGCLCSSPFSTHQYGGDSKKIRTFGRLYRSGSGVQVPDDLSALPSAHIHSNFFGDPTLPLYEAEIDQGYGCRGIRPLVPILLIVSIPLAAAVVVLKQVFSSYGFRCDESFQWVRKEYSSRIYYRVYSNRIEVNTPSCRLFGMLGCGSWNTDVIQTHPFDRGAFGFRRVNTLVVSYLCCLWPTYGWTVARQRCQCNGPLWHGGFWCDEWPCDIWFCTYRYTGLADPDEVVMASSIALQAYFEGRRITKEDLDNCLDYWRENLSEQTDPVGRKRDACCEPCPLPMPSGTHVYRLCCHFKRSIPYGEDSPQNTTEVKKAYNKYNELRGKQIEAYSTFWGPQHKSTICKTCGCRRVFGRKGMIFCTEGCSNCCYLRNRQPGDPAPAPFEHRDIDDENDASLVLRKVLGDPPANVAYSRWVYDEERNEHTLMTYPEKNVGSNVLDEETPAHDVLVPPPGGNVEDGVDDKWC